MYKKKMNSTQALSKKFSKIKLINSQSGHETPGKRQFSANKKIGLQVLQQNAIVKNKKLSIMIQNAHHFITNLGEAQWILKQLQKIMSVYIKQSLKKHRVAHQLQIQNLYDEFIKLVQRFTGMEKASIRELTIPIKMYSGGLSENQNCLNMKKTETIGSFRYTDMDQIDNQQQYPSDFCHINLPTVVKEQSIMQNISSERQQWKQQQSQIRQYDATITILNQQIQKLKQEKQQIKHTLSLKLQKSAQQIQRIQMDWQAYRVYAGSTIGKCQQMLGQISGSLSDRQQIDRILNQLFVWENRIDHDVIEYKQNQFQDYKSARIREISELDWKIKQRKQQYNNSYKNNKGINQKIKVQLHTASIPNNNYTKNMDNLHQNHQINQSLSRMLYLQATTIQNLLDAS